MKLNLEDIKDIYAELPPLVQTSIISLLHTMESRSNRFKQDYPEVIACYLQATEFFDIDVSEPFFEGEGYKQITVRKNENTSTLLENKQTIFFRDRVNT